MPDDLRPDLPVAAPLAWSELPKINSASCLSINDAAEPTERAGGHRLRGYDVPNRRCRA